MHRTYPVGCRATNLQVDRQACMHTTSHHQIQPSQGARGTPRNSLVHGIPRAPLTCCLLSQRLLTPGEHTNLEVFISLGKYFPGKKLLRAEDKRLGPCGRSLFVVFPDSEMLSPFHIFPMIVLPLFWGERDPCTSLTLPSARMFDENKKNPNLNKTLRSRAYPTEQIFPLAKQICSAGHTGKIV